jgi:K(+)-stimulated pyrophosphate-energized sodium pump
MNILIKLTCLIGLVIAPMLVDGSSSEDKNNANGAPTECCGSMKECSADGAKFHANMKCDVSKCSEMTLDQCMAMCDEKGCSAEEKEMCKSMYNEAGEFVGHGDQKML